MPDVPPPEELANELDLIRGMADRIPEVAAQGDHAGPTDRLSSGVADRSVSSGEACRRCGICGCARSRSCLTIQLIHQAVLAYASDYGLLGTALLPHGVAPRSPALQLATLDHAFWAHRPFRADEWLLYAMDSPVAAGARGFTRGAFYTRDGQLVASVAQEGLMRPREAK